MIRRARGDRRSCSPRSLAGCAPELGKPYLDAFAAGDRAFHAGRYDEAARAWDDAAGKARRVKDRDEARFLEARSYERASLWSDARARVPAPRRRLAGRAPHRARGASSSPQIEIAHGDAARGGRCSTRRRGASRPTASRVRRSAAW